MTEEDSFEMSIAGILEKIDHIITASHCLVTGDAAGDHKPAATVEQIARNCHGACWYGGGGYLGSVWDTSQGTQSEHHGPPWQTGSQTGSHQGEFRRHKQVITEMSHKCHGISNHQQLDCIFIGLLMLPIKQTPVLCIASPSWRESIDYWWIPHSKVQ